MSSDLDNDAIFAEISEERRFIARTLETFTPPGHGPMAPLSDVIVHGLDMT